MLQSSDHNKKSAANARLANGNNHNTKTNMEAERLVIDIPRLDKDGERFVGEIPASEIAFEDEPMFSLSGNLAYELLVEKVGGELLIRGTASAPFSCICARCGNDFEFIAEDRDVVLSFATADIKEDFLDLTDSLRECIILCLPTNPICGSADDDCAREGDGWKFVSE